MLPFPEDNLQYKGCLSSSGPRGSLLQPRLATLHGVGLSSW
jgi:hypothetical protein